MESECSLLLRLKGKSEKDRDKREGDAASGNIQAASLFMVLFCREVSKTEVKTTHVANMGAAGKSGVMGRGMSRVIDL